MAGIKEMIQKYAEIAKELPEQRQKLALIFAHDAHALVAQRIQNTGVDAKGAKMKLYSENTFRYWLLNESEFNSPTKIEKFKRDASNKKNNGSYRALRQVYGLPVDKRTLTFDGDMWKSIEPTVIYHDEFKTVVEIKAKDKVNQEKIDKNSKIVNVNILAFGEDELEFISELNKERIKDLFYGA